MHFFMPPAIIINMAFSSIHHVCAAPLPKPTVLPLALSILIRLNQQSV
jgi:hypothetical protein